MSAGRPHNSITPEWRSKPAARICAWKLVQYLANREITKSDCARQLKLSRHTVIKWWNTIDWERDYNNFETFMDWRIFWMFHPEKTLHECSREIGLSPEYVLFMENIRKESEKMTDDYNIDIIRTEIEEVEKREKNWYFGKRRYKFQKKS